MRHLNALNLGSTALLAAVLLLLQSSSPCQAFHVNRPLQLSNTLQQASTTFLSVLRDFRLTRTVRPYQDGDDEYGDDDNQEAMYAPNRLTFTQLLQQQQDSASRHPNTKRRQHGAHDSEFVAEANLPTDLGSFRMRGYRSPHNPSMEPCVIYAADKTRLGSDNVPVRIHDQCLTSEVFGSLRYVVVDGTIRGHSFPRSMWVSHLTSPFFMRPNKTVVTAINSC